jgi:hypothetical protein
MTTDEKGIRVEIFKASNSHNDTSNSGISYFWDEAILIVEGGYIEVGDHNRVLPVIRIVNGVFDGTAIAVLDWSVGPFAGYPPESDANRMFGGTYVASSDTRFRREVERVTGSRFYGAVPLHDRYETPAQSEVLSR